MTYVMNIIHFNKYDLGLAVFFDFDCVRSI